MIVFVWLKGCEVQKKPHIFLKLYPKFTRSLHELIIEIDLAALGLIKPNNSLMNIKVILYLICKYIMYIPLVCNPSKLTNNESVIMSTNLTSPLHMYS